MLYPFKVMRRRRINKMLNRSLPTIGRIGMGVAMGAATMYLMDPNRGWRRRALARDRLNHATHVVQEGARVMARDLNNRFYGLWAIVRGCFRRRGTNDEVVITRVRSKLGRVVSHPHAMEVAVRDGKVTLSGPILAREVDALLACVRKVRGVRGDVDNRLVVYKESGNVSALQGGRPREGGHFELMQTNWSPAARLLTSMAGAALVFAGLRQRTPISVALAAVGVGLLARGVTNRELMSFVGVGEQCRGIDVYKTINIDAIPLPA